MAFGIHLFSYYACMADIRIRWFYFLKTINLENQKVCTHYIVTMVNWERCKSERYGRGGRRSTVTLTKKLFFTRGASRKNRLVFSNKLNSLIVFGPAAILVQKLTDKSAWVFFLSLVGITPLAERLGYATEQLAFYTGPTVRGLLNATLGIQQN
nr:vacuolar cation/proton exchanger 2 [Quercus suber]